MPPKKLATKSAKTISNETPREEPRGPPTNVCDFKIAMEVKHEAGHYLKIKYSWIEVDPSTKEISFPMTDTGYFFDWTLVQIEGEDPNENESVLESQPKINSAKGTAAKSKAAANQKNQAKGLPEQTDNRPRTIKFLKDFGAEDSGPNAGLNVTEPVAIAFSNAQLHLELYDTKRETLEETLLDSITLDISSMLYPEGSIEFHARFSKIKCEALEYLDLHISSEKPMLSDFYRKKLNPLQINLVSLKDIPFKTEPKYKPIHATLRFLDGQSFDTVALPQQKNCRFVHKHVFLVGLLSAVHLKELLSTELVRVILHDNDEFTTELDADQEFSVGQATFTLRDFLRPFTHELKLRSDVFPLKRRVTDKTNLDLNKTARRNEKTVERFSPYLVNSTYAVIQANLAYPIGKFNEALELAVFDRMYREQQLLQQQNQQAALEQQTQAKSVKKQTSITSPKTNSVKEETKSKMTAESSQADLTSQEYISAQSMAPKEDFSGAVFERLVIVVPYVAPDAVKIIETNFELINMRNLNFESVAQLNTKELSEEERADRSLDFLCGFEIMDTEFRMFIIEGLGGPDHALYQFYKANERTRPNDKRFKMLYNPQVRFRNRLYMDFNVAMKRIRLREPLSKTMKTSDVYLRSKVPEDMYDTMQKFAEIRKLDRAALVRDFNLFPVPERLLILERKYGDALSFEDISGIRLRKRRRNRDANVTATTDCVVLGTGDGMASELGRSTIHAQSQGELLSASAIRSQTIAIQNQDTDSEQELILPTRQRVKGDTENQNLIYEQTLRNRRMTASHNYIRKNKQSTKTLEPSRNIKPRIDLPDGFECHMYGSQKNNIWELQKEQIRKTIANDKEHFYTYSKDYLGGAFPIVNEHKARVKAKADNEAQWRTKLGFDNLNKRQNWNEHAKKPDVAKLDELRYPYVQQAGITKTRLAQKMYRPQEDGKPVFRAGSKNVPYTFSEQGYFKTVFSENAEDSARQQQMQKQKEAEEWEKKVVVTNKNFHVNTRYPSKANQRDKMRSMLQDPPTRIGLRLKNSRLTQMAGRQITATQSLSELPVSMMSKEPYIMNEKSFKPFKGRLDTAKTPQNMATGLRETKDFVRYSKQGGDTLGKKVQSRVPIRPLTDLEKVGPKFSTRRSQQV